MILLLWGCNLSHGLVFLKTWQGSHLHRLFSKWRALAFVCSNVKQNNQKMSATLFMCKSVLIPKKSFIEQMDGGHTTNTRQACQVMLCCWDYAMEFLSQLTTIFREEKIVHALICLIDASAMAPTASKSLASFKFLVAWMQEVSVLAAHKNKHPSINANPEL